MATSRGLKQSLLDFRRHPWLHVLSICTIATSLVILGIFFVSYRNYKKILEGHGGSITGTIYLQPHLDQATVDALREELSSLPFVTSVAFKTQDEVLRDLEGYLGENNDALASEDLFPHVMEAKVSAGADSVALSQLKVAMSQYPQVTEVDFSEGWLAQFNRISRFLKLAGFLLVFGVLIGCAFIIANFMGMRMQARRHEIDVIRLMGASKSFILLPFLWEGLLEGLLGAGLAVVTLFCLQEVLLGFLHSGWTSLFGIQEWLFLSLSQIFLVLLIGVVMALLGSLTLFFRVREF